MNNTPKTLVFDIETSPILGKVWSLWKQNVGLNQIENDWYIMSFSASWLGSGKVEYMDNRGLGEDDTGLLSRLWELLDESDYVIAHNGRKFDCGKINARFIQHGMLPPSPYRIIDTLEIARRRFNFTSNKLEYLANALHCAPKMVNRKFNGMELWNECLLDNMEAWDEMEKYNIQDTITLEEVFYKLRPWMTNQMNHNLFIEEEDSEPVCNVCGSPELHRRGFAYTAQGKFQRYRCTSCGSWSRDTRKVKGSTITGITI